MDFDDDLSSEDIAFLDVEIDKCIGSSVRSPKTQNVQTSESSIQDTPPIDLYDISNCFDDDDNEPQMEHLECLRSKFGHCSFREKQWEIIQKLNEKRDVCAVMATGYGKSLCYQFTAVYTNQITLVVSPLIALMQAQVMDLQSAGISACLVGSAQKDMKILEQIAAGRFTIIYSSPEYLQTSNGDKLFSILRGRLALIAVDEAHCVSQWGHDFRPDFRKLNMIRQKLPSTPILAVTATATENVRHDIVSILGLKEPRVIVTSFDRANLEFVIQKKTSVRSDLPHRIKDVDGSVIVYVLKRKVAEDIAKQLNQIGINCDHYHAGLDINKRTEVLEKFLNDELKVIVATIAFGMGIDKKDIRCVIHYGASKNLETYYQEVGRAGRDGKAAKVITFFSPDDFELHDWFLDDESSKKELSPIIKNYLRSLAAKMREFLYSTQCRRKIILEYFGESTILLPRPNCCDNCTIGLGSWRLTDLYEDVDEDGMYDFAVEAKILLEAIKCLIRNNISTEKSLLKKFLIGKFDQRLRSVQCERLYASGRMHPEHYWLALAEQLMQNEFIGVMANTIKLTLETKAVDWLRNTGSLQLKAIGQMYEYFEKKQSTPLVVGLKANRYNVTKAVSELLRKDYVESDELLKQILSEVRDVIAVVKSVPDKELISTMADLNKMCKSKPQNMDELRFASLAGFNAEKLNKYGPTFVNTIVKFVKGELEMQNVLLNNPMPNVQMDHVISPQILRLLKDRKTKEDILQLTNLTEDQLYTDIGTLIQTGQPVLKTDLAYLSHIDFKAFRNCINEQDDSTMLITQDILNEVQRKYFDSTSHQIDTGFTRLALVYHTVRLHLNRLNIAYVDCEENVLKNADQLMVDERQETVNSTFQTDRQYPPFRRYHPNIIDLLFSDRVSYARYDDSLFESEDEFAMDYMSYEHFESDNSGESNDGSDVESNDGSDVESDDGSDVESDVESEQEVNEESMNESDENSTGESESEGETGSDDESEEENVTDVSSVSSVSTVSSVSSVSTVSSDFNYDNERGIYSPKRRRILNQ